VRRRGRLFVINKKHPRWTARQGWLWGDLRSGKHAVAPGYPRSGGRLLDMVRWPGERCRERPARRDSWPVSAAMQKTLLTRRNVVVVRRGALAARGHVPPSGV